MRKNSILPALMLTLTLLPAVGSAVPIGYAGDLSDGALHEGSVAFDGWSNGPGAVDFWNYGGTAGRTVSLLTENNDPADGGDLLVAIYEGTTTAFEDFLATPSHLDQPFDWGGLSGLLQFELAAGASLVQDFLVPFDGAYTLAVGGAGFAPFGTGPIDYAVQAVPPVAVPEPGTLGLLLIGMLCAPAVRRWL